MYVNSLQGIQVMQYEIIIYNRYALYMTATFLVPFEVICILQINFAFDSSRIKSLFSYLFLRKKISAFDINTNYIYL